MLFTGAGRPIKKCFVPYNVFVFRFWRNKNVANGFVYKTNTGKFLADAVIERSLKPTAAEPNILGQIFFAAMFLLIRNRNNAQNNIVGV